MSTNLARLADPATSHDAIPPRHKRSLQKNAILWLLNNVGPMTDHELARQYARRRMEKGWPATQQDSVRKRRAELKAAGLVYDTGQVAGLPGMPASIVWDTVEGATDVR